MSELRFELLRMAGRGYCCSQMIVLLALRQQGTENPGLVRAAQGLCNGLGQSQETCGVLTGAALVLGLYAGKGSDAEEAHERLPLMLAELSDWFRDTACAGCGGTRCMDIMGPDARPDPAKCGDLLDAAWSKVLEILASESIDPTLPREDAP